MLCPSEWLYNLSDELFFFAIPAPTLKVLPFHEEKFRSSLTRFTRREVVQQSFPNYFESYGKIEIFQLIVEREVRAEKAFLKFFFF